MSKRDAARRLLGVLLTLRNHHGRITLAELRRKFPEYDTPDPEAGRRKFERDKKDLRELGVQVRHDPVDGEHGYVLDLEASFLTEPLSLEPKETALLSALSGDAIENPAFPYATALKVALSKLGVPTGEAAGLLVHHPVRDDVDAIAGRLGTLSEAVLRCKRVHFGYTKGGGEPVPWTVAPYGLFLERGHWYLCAVPRDGKRPYTFRVSRMRDVAFVRPGADGAEFEIPEDFDLGEHDPTAAYRFKVHEPVTVTLRVDPEVAHLARSQWGDPDPGDPTRFLVETTHADAVLGWVLKMGNRAEVEGPPAIRARMRAVLMELLEEHEGTA